MLVLICVYILILGCLGSSSDVVPLDLPLTNGLVTCSFFESLNSSSYFQCLGIPYAQPPIGDLRFEAPQPSAHWDGVLNATTEKPSCVTTTYTTNSTSQSEDCLYLNVFSPNFQPLILLPVVVWIYGGGFNSGNSSKDFYGPDFLVREEIVVVTFNYRLGPFGFISTGDERIPGNNGLKDQNLALQYIKENIHCFGGDPNKVTIFGESAGAASVGLHLLSDKSVGLFRAGILNSGSSLNFWACQENPAYIFNSYALLLPGFIADNITLGTKAALRKQSTEALIEAFNNLPSITGTIVDFVPVIEVPNNDSFITRSHYESLITGNFSKVPILIGINYEESLALFGSTSALELAALSYDLNPESLIPMNLNVSIINQPSAISQIRNMYLVEGSTFLANLTAAAKYTSDNYIVRPSLKQAELCSIFSEVYLYEFDYYGSRHFLSAASINGTNEASHSDELPYLFYAPDYAYSTNASDVLTQNRMVTMWTNFVKFLNPTPLPLSLLNDTIWKPYTNSTPYYLKINTTIELLTNLRTEMLEDWDYVFDTYGEKPFITY